MNGEPVVTLDEQRDELRALLAEQSQSHARDKVSEALLVGELKTAFVAEGRPEKAFMAWVCGEDSQHVSRAALYDRLSASRALNAGIRTGKEGRHVFSHLVAAGRRLERGLTPAEVQQEISDGNVTIRAANPEQEGLSKVWIPDTCLAQLERVRSRVQLAFADAGAELPGNNPETMAALLDLVDAASDEVLALMARSAIDELEKYVEARFGNSRTVTLVSQEKDEYDSLAVLAPLIVLWESDYLAQLAEHRPSWYFVEILENGKISNMMIREDR